MLSWAKSVINWNIFCRRLVRINGKTGSASTMYLFTLLVKRRQWRYSKKASDSSTQLKVFNLIISFSTHLTLFWSFVKTWCGFFWHNHCRAFNIIAFGKWSNFMLRRKLFVTCTYLNWICDFFFHFVCLFVLFVCTEFIKIYKQSKCFWLKSLLCSYFHPLSYSTLHQCAAPFARCDFPFNVEKCLQSIYIQLENYLIPTSN